MDNRNNADKNEHTIQADVKFQSKDKSHLLLLPYQGEKGLHLTKSLKRNLKSLLPSTVKAILDLQAKSSAHVFKLRIKQSLSTNMTLFTKQLVQKIIVQKSISEKTGAQVPKE